MTDNDLLKEAKEFEHCQEYEHCNADGIIEGLLELIEENEIKANHRYLDLQQVCDDQSKLIARLGAAYLQSQAARLFYAAQNAGAQWGQVGESFREPYEKTARESLERIKAGGQG